MSETPSPDIEALADAILRAAGSGLRFYSMQSTRDRIIRATEEAVQAGRDHLRSAAEGSE